MDARELFDRAAATYDIAAFPFFAPFGRELVEFSEVDGFERVLDVGCGAGAVLAPVAERTTMATGIELSPAMAERARVAAPSAEVVVGDAASLPFESGSFDVVLSSFVVFFMPDPTAALREWGRVLKPHGRLVMATWGGSDPRWSSWERELRYGYVKEMDPAVAQDLGAGLALVERFTTPEKVRAELEAAGFDTDEQDTFALEFVYPDVDAWWDWNWSHGSRVYLEALSEDAQRRFRDDMASAMEQVRESRGYPRTFTSLFTRGSIRVTDSAL